VIPADSKINQILKVQKYRSNGEPIVRFEQHSRSQTARMYFDGALAVAQGIGFGRI
jgi:hypothetical protein